MTRQTGFVYRFDSERGCGQICVNGRSRKGDRIFFHAAYVQPDVLGRKSICPNSPVSFEILYTAGKSGEKRRETAINIRNLDPDLQFIDVDKHEEYGQVRTWDGSVGYLIRPSKDTLRFTKRAVISEGIETIRVGTWLHYFIGRVQNDECQPVGFFARDISVCLDPEPAMESAAAEEIPAYE